MRASTPWIRSIWQAWNQVPDLTHVDVVIGRERTQASQVVQTRPTSWRASSPCCLRNSPGRWPRRIFGITNRGCGHGSSLSPAMHALVAARLGDTDMALRYLHDIDDFDSDPTAAGGVRIAGVGGIWQAIVLGVRRP